MENYGNRVFYGTGQLPRKPVGSIAVTIMKRYFITFLFLILAIVFYALGAAGPGTILLFLGFIAEVTFWFRIFGNGKGATEK